MLIWLNRLSSETTTASSDGNQMTPESYEKFTLSLIKTAMLLPVKLKFLTRSEIGKEVKKVGYRLSVARRIHFSN